jgi:hypothetical protein
MRYYLICNICLKAKINEVTTETQASVNTDDEHQHPKQTECMSMGQYSHLAGSLQIQSKFQTSLIVIFFDQFSWLL